MRYLLYDITHTTAHDYVGAVSVSHHLARLAPREDPRQRCLTYELTVEPAPAVTSTHRDYFGNAAHLVAIERPHSRLVITSRSRVAVRPASTPEPDETPAWEYVRSRCRADRSGSTLEAHEFIYASPLVPVDGDYADYAGPSFPKGRPVLEAMTELTRRIHSEFKFDSGATSVGTTVKEFFAQRRGVCQDFAQFQIACLRSLGLPARYVSGYLETDPPAGQPKLRGADASHAWVSFFCPGLGWVDVDPTNNCLPSLRHITIGWGRDYSDVAPVRGVLVGGRDQTLSVSVDVVALGPWEPEEG